VATVAAEEFFDAKLDGDVVAEALGLVTMPGRFEVLARQPLVVVDGAHNAAGADSCADVYFGDFAPEGRRLLVFGALSGRDVADTLSALRVDDFDTVWCTTADSPRALPASEIAATAASMGCDDVRTCPPVREACDRALADAGPDDAVLVTGSLYVVGEARPHLARVLP
jgi:folylpolyglutamate synthase/dihydropteroate synthase